MKLRSLLILCLFIAMCISPASALLWGYNAKSLWNGNGFYSDDDGHNYVCVVTEDTPNTITLVDTMTGIGTTLIIANSGVTIYSASVGNDGTLYFSTSQGLFKRNDRYTTPYYTNYTLEAHGAKLTQISTDVVHHIRDDGEYVYYQDDVTKSVKFFNRASLIVNTYYDYHLIGVLNTESIMGFDIYNGSCYFLVHKGSSPCYMRIYRNDTLLNGYTTAYTGTQYASAGLQVVESGLIYYDWCMKATTSQVVSDEGVLYPNGTKIRSNGLVHPTPTIWHRNVIHVGPELPSMAYINGDNLEIVAVSDYGRVTGEPEADPDIPKNLNATISWDQFTYGPGDRANISFDVENPDYDEYTYQIRIGDTAGIKQTVTVDDVEGGSVFYNFSVTAVSDTYLAQILATDSTGKTAILAGAVASFENEQDYSISFSKDTYAYGDNMEIFYYGLPTNTQVYLRGTKSDPFEVVYTKSYYKTGTGSIILSVPSQTATDYAVYAIWNNYTLASDYCDVAISASQATLSGIVRDAQTGARIDGAHVMLDGIGPYTDEVGSYSMIRDIGTYTLTVSADGYHTYSQTIDLFTNKVWPVYLTPSNYAGNLYGSVTDYATGDKLSGVQITVQNGTSTKTALTGSGGFYSIAGLANGTMYSFTAKLTGYDTYSNSSLVIDQVTWQDVKLIPTGYSEPASGESSTTSDRPDRDAAENVVGDWYQNVPGIFQVVTVLFLLVVVRRGTK